MAVSGGKDSLALWDLLLELGYDTEGMTIGPRHRRLQHRQCGRPHSRSPSAVP